MKKTMKFGESIVEGVTEDINVVITETAKGTSIVGEKPFGGKPLSFVPMPEGSKGMYPIYKMEKLSQIVEMEENTIFRMGSVPTCYYEYEGGYCYLYYDIYDKAEVSADDE